MGVEATGLEQAQSERTKEVVDGRQAECSEEGRNQIEDAVRQDLRSIEELLDQTLDVVHD